jgi:hypothetical protein
MDEQEITRGCVRAASVRSERITGNSGTINLGDKPSTSRITMKPGKLQILRSSAFGGSLDKVALYLFMKRARYGVIASLGPDEVPQSALVGVAVTPDLEIVFDTLAKTRKYANLSAHSACSVSLWWGGEQAVQMDGTAFEPTGSALDQYREAYFAVWPDGRARLAWAGITHFVVQPRWIRVIDYDQSPPLIEETRF